MTRQTYPLSKHDAEELPMKKYIVEAPEPKRGQKLSSGGIRENGKIAVQFKNPHPYSEPLDAASLVKAPDNAQLIDRAKRQNQRHQTGMYLFSIVWQELGEPLVRFGLQELKHKIISKTESASQDQSTIAYPENPHIIDIEPDDIRIEYDGNITPFPKRSVV